MHFQICSLKKYIFQSALSKKAFSNILSKNTFSRLLSQKYSLKKYFFKNTCSKIHSQNCSLKKYFLKKYIFKNEKILFKILSLARQFQIYSLKKWFSKLLS